MAVSGTISPVTQTRDRHPARWFPGLHTVRSYRAAWFRHDVTAGLVLTALLVPAGMGYAEAAGLPAVTGLYATIVPLLVYAVVGPSRVLVFGPDSSLAPLIAATVLPLAGADLDRVTALAAALSLLAGAMSLIAGLARFGYLTDLLSLPVRYGYLNGIALLSFVSQFAKLCDIPSGSGGLIDSLRALVDGLRAGDANRTSVLLGGGALTPHPRDAALGAGDTRPARRRRRRDRRRQLVRPRRSRHLPRG
jgi:MFS superfamily sulfate permease-like transporter